MRGRARAEVGLVDECRAEPAQRGVARDSRPRNAAADDQYVHGRLDHGRPGCGPRLLLLPAPSGGELEQTRAAAWASMIETPVDVLIIGGGITGAGIARDAALRGFRTALVDKSDFGAGTSSHSSRLIHGGIRYLEQRAVHLVFEASHERRVLLRIAPHLVRPLAFLFPVYRGGRIPAWKLRAGMWLYDLLSVFRNVHWHRWLRAKKVRRVEPGLRDRGLVGAALY